MRVVLNCVSAAPMERLAWKLMEVMLVATGEMAAAAEAHRLHDLTHAIEALLVVLVEISGGQFR